MRPLLLGERVWLDALTIADAETLASWERDTAGTRLHLSNAVRPGVAADWVRRVEGMNADQSCFPFAVRLLADDTLVGEAALDGVVWNHRCCSLGIVIAAAQRGQGLGTEVMDLLLTYAFDELNLHRVGLGVFGYNRGALALYARLGFVEEGREREWGRRDGAWFDLVHLGILEPEWRALRTCSQRG